MVAGSTVRAAELLQVTQPAISRNIAELEATVGFSLFDRVRGRLVPTPEGQMFFREVDTSFRGLDRLRASAATIRDYGSGSIRIASLSALGSHLVPNAVHRFLQDNARIKVSLQVLPSTAVRNLVADGQFDLGLAADEIDLAGIDSQVFGSFPAMCAMHRDHPLAGQSQLTPSDLAGFALIGLAPEDRARHRIDRVFKDAAQEPGYVIETPSSTTICALALAGAGVGFVNPMTVHGFIERGLVLRSFTPRVDFRCYMLFRPDAQKTRLVRSMVGFLLEERNRTSYAVSNDANPR